MEWISLKDQVPQFEMAVLACDKEKEKSLSIVRLIQKTETKDSVSFQWYINNSFDESYEDFTHWMPLPKFPIK